MRTCTTCATCWMRWTPSVPTGEALWTALLAQALADAFDVVRPGLGGLD
jgi:hypothetical protein